MRSPVMMAILFLLLYAISYSRSSNHQMTNFQESTKKSPKTIPAKKNAFIEDHFYKVRKTGEAEPKRFRRQILPNSPSSVATSLSPTPLWSTHSTITTKLSVSENIKRESSQLPSLLPSSSQLKTVTSRISPTKTVTATTTHPQQPSKSESKSSPPSLEYPQCSPELSCQGRCVYKGFSPYNSDCHCDPECEVFMDCCADYDRYCNASMARRPTTTNETLGLWKCYKIGFSEKNNIRMISGCPSSWSNASVALGCAENSNKPLSNDNYADAVPVVDKQTNKTYRNRFCATCNGVEEKDLDSYAIHFGCTETAAEGLSHKEKLEFMFKHCNDIHWKPKNGQPARKCFEVITECLTWGCELALLKTSTECFRSFTKCKNNPPRIVFRSNSYNNFKNIDCFSCMSLVSNELICGPGYKPEAPPTPASFNVIVNIDANDQDKTKDKEPQKIDLSCGEMEVYDPYLKHCRPALNARPAPEFPFPPISHDSLAYFNKYRIAFWVNPSSPSKLVISMFNSSDIVNLFTQNIAVNESQMQIKEKSQEEGSEIAVVIFDVHISEENNTKPENVRRNDHETAKMSISSILELSSPLQLYWNKEMFTVIKVTSRRTSCINTKYYTADKYKVLPGSHNVFIYETGKVFNEIEYLSMKTTPQDGLRFPDDLIAVCTKEILLGIRGFDCTNGILNKTTNKNVTNIPVSIAKCKQEIVVFDCKTIENVTHTPISIAKCKQEIVVFDCKNGTFITLTSEEFVMLPNNSVFRNVSGTVYNAGEYSEMKNGSVIVCSNFSRNYTKLFQVVDERRKKTIHGTILMIMTCVGLSLSVFCLLATLITYLLFAELRTLPGINLMNLSSALLVAHFFWLIGSGLTGSHTACVAMAVILHFAFLASFAWMSIIAFSTWKAFSSSGGHVGISQDKEYRRRQIRKMMAIGWVPGLFFVLICLSLDQSAAVSIQYGGSKGCWINNGIANLCIFVVPIIIAMIWNAVFFGLTVRAICKTQKQTSMVTQQRTNQHNYAVYVKIAILMGFTWIFGVLGSFVSQYFLYPFVILSTIQGVYIAVSFTFNRRAFNLYKTKFEAVGFCVCQPKEEPRENTNRKRQLTVETKL